LFPVGRTPSEFAVSPQNRSLWYGSERRLADTEP
jgi:hypothetical protein